MLQRIRHSQVWKSIFRHPLPVDRRNRIRVVLMNWVLHVHPISLPQHALRFSYTWYMGLLAFYLFVVETVTGVMLMFAYRPTLEWAYNDMLALRHVTTLGIVREIHRWGAHAMVIVVMLHMYRVFLTGSYKHPREFNWCIGVLLLVATLLLSFTGYLLPWDQLSMWAVTVGTNMARSVPFMAQERPGYQVGEETLNLFYVLHCLAIPLAAGFLVGIHFWRVRKDGSISGPVDWSDL
jgi:quinol-cytochrome oxidoreductase complex cytochrome b subunit